MTDGRRAGVVVLLLLVAGAVGAAAFPQLGAVRLGGVALAWWYGVVAAPLLAAFVALLLHRGGPVAAWMSPALVGALVPRVFAGEPSALALALVGATAPLLAPLAPRPLSGHDRVTTTLVAASAGLALGGSLLVAADVARLLGVARWPALGVVAALTALALLGPALASRALWPGLLALAVPLIAIPLLGGPTPWEAWTALAARPALVFAEASPGTRQGVRVLEPTTLAFGEPHRVMAMREGVYRVLAREGDREAMREWRLTPGDSLTLRPGDRLDLTAGMRVRFEAGRRVPGAAASGVAWAETRGLDPIADATEVLGAALSLTGGAAVLLARRRWRERESPTKGARAAAIVAALAPWLLVLIVVCAGVYGAFAAPDLSLGAPGIAPLLGLPDVLPGAPWGRPLVTVILGGMGALLVATAGGLRRQVVPHGFMKTLRAPAFWVLIGAAAAVVLLGPKDSWRALSLGCGLAASAVAAPALAGGGSRARLAGALVGAGAFVTLALGLTGIDLPASVAAYPVLMAAPLAFAATSLAGSWAGRANFGRLVAARKQG
jgi:hypothetical protein